MSVNEQSARFKFVRSNEDEIANRAIYLPPSHEKRKTLILDIDETLLHVIREADIPENSLKKLIVLELEVGEERLVVALRPNVLEFLEHTSKSFELMLFTSGTEEYAHAVLQILDPHNKLFVDVLNRGHCIERGGLFIKDLDIVKGRLIKDILILDNREESFLFHPHNGIPIKDFVG